MSIADVVGTIDEIASALDALHERGIVHRDVKPANVIRDPFRNRSVLVDVGIARRYGQLVESAGTPGYVAPEVIGGQAANARSDVYGLAATAYTLFTLTMPWLDDDQVMIRQCSGEPPAAASSLRPELAAADELLLAALSKDPLERPASAGALARGLRVALDVKLEPPRRETRWAGGTILPSRATTMPRTRGVVFRSVTRALGIRGGERLRDHIGNEHPDLARVLTESAPLEWLPTELLARLLAIAPGHVERERGSLARDIARATVRASFRRFFPASAATLVPERTLSAIRTVWSRYHTWGTVSSMPVHATENVVQLTGTLRDPGLCAWTSGLLEQLVTLSGGSSVVVDHRACEARGDDGCTYHVTWDQTG
jgi:uncharacterized protein (TIGR02265 family)